MAREKINNFEKDQKKIDDLADAMRSTFEISENSMIVLKNLALSSFTKTEDFDYWKEQMKLKRSQLKQDVLNSGKQLKKAIVGSFEKQTKSIDLDIKAEVDKPLLLLEKQTMKEFDKSVANVYKLKNHVLLYDAILKQANDISEGLSIVYKDGRHMNFKSYMEMNVRTTVRQEINDNLFKTSSENKVVFYLCNSFGDSAKDHADFQGKYYFDENYADFGFDDETIQKIEDLINSRKMESFQSVVYDEPYLTTRPNCRHYLEPLTLDEVLENKNPKKLVKELGLEKNGKYEENKTDLREEQRYNERQIRKFKNRIEQTTLMNRQNPNVAFLNKIRKDQNKLSYWLERQSNFCEENKLKRDHRRESNKIILQDAGVGYKIGLATKGRYNVIK